MINDKYPVNRGSEGNLRIKEDMQKRLTNLQEYMCEKHSKTLVVRYDLHYPREYQSSGDNKDISRTTAKLIQHYKRLGIDTAYAWSRERGQSHNPHYHCVLFLDGQKVNSYMSVFYNASKYWSSTIGCKGTIHYCLEDRKGNPQENGIMIANSKDHKREDRFNDSHYQVSYLSKVRDKAPAKDGLRDYGMSRISKIASD